MMAYSAWRKKGTVLLACRVVGLALELLLKTESEQDLSVVSTEHCAAVELWHTQYWEADGQWSTPKTGVVPVRAIHRTLALYVMRRLLVWVAGLGLAVKDAVVAKTRVEGCGHHDLILKHTGTARPYCEGFISTEIKLSAVGENGRKFNAAWAEEQARCEEALAKILRRPKTQYGAAMLLLVGIADGPQLLAPEPPLMAKAQLLTLNDDGSPKWGPVVLERGTVPVEPPRPPPKRQRHGASWDEIRVALASKQHDIDGDGVLRARLLDLFKAISPKKTNKNPGQKLQTYQKELGLSEPIDFIRRRYPASQRGSEAVWLTLDAVQRIYAYELRQ